MALSSIRVIGIGVDSATDTLASIQIRDVPPGLSQQEAYERVYINSEFYGVLVQQAADAIQSLVQDDGYRYMQPDRLATYRWQSLVTLGFGVIGAAALAWALFMATGSGLASAFAWGVLMTTPLYTGMLTVDFKDVPVAAGLTLISAGLVALLSTQRKRRHQLFGWLCIAAGAIIATGTRAGSWIIMLALLCPIVLLLLVRDGRAGSRKAVLADLLGLSTALIATCAFLIATNPFARTGLLSWLLDAAATAGRFPWAGTIRTLGMDVSATDVPWWYVPAWICAQLPVLTLISVAFGVGWILRDTLSTIRTRRPSHALIAVSPLVLQGLLIPALVGLAAASLYDGIRQLLFMLPALIGLAAYGVARFDIACSSMARASAWWLGIRTFVLAVALLGVWANARWYPYSYAFINPIAGARHDTRDWELDYWGVTALEGVRALATMGAQRVDVYPINGAPDVYRNEVAAAQVPGAPPSSGVFVFDRWDASLNKLGCREVITIVRDGHTLGRGGLC